MTRSLAVSMLVGGLLFANAAPSSADTITFDNSSLHPGGTMTIGSTVTLTFAVIDAVAHSSPPGGGFNVSGSCGIPGAAIYGCLTITTGQFIGADPNTTANDYIYSGVGSSITITGGISSGSLNLANNTLLFSTFFDLNSNITLTFDDICQTQPSECTGALGGTLAAGTLNALLASALGVSQNTLGGNDQNLYMSFVGLSMPTGMNPPSGSALGNVNQLEVVTPRTSNLVPLPEPGTLILFGSGLVFAARLARKRLRT